MRSSIAALCVALLARRSRAFRRAARPGRHAARHRRRPDRRRHRRRHGHRRPASRRRRRPRRRRRRRRRAQGIATIPGSCPAATPCRRHSPDSRRGTLPDVRVRTGDNRQVLLLPIEGLKDAVVVEQNQQEAAVDPRGPSFGTTLTREQLEALSDDPDELRQQLQDMAGPGAVIKVDSFEGGALPPKAQIQSIRISRDQFAAENHSAGGTQIEIITQPGLGPIRFNTGIRMRSDAARRPQPVHADARARAEPQLLLRRRTARSSRTRARSTCSSTATTRYDTPNINVALGGRTRSEALAIRAPRDNINVNAQVDYALTLDQTLRFGFNANRTDNRNLGIGAFDEEERAYSHGEHSRHTIRAQHMGPLGRRAFTRTRVQVGVDRLGVALGGRGADDPRERRVHERRRAGRRRPALAQRRLRLRSRLRARHPHGAHRHPARRRALALGRHRRTTSAPTRSRASTRFTPDARAATRAASAIRTSATQNVQGGVYVQDDVRVRRNLTLSAGVRYEAQTHVRDFDNVAPRFGVTWAPFASGQTTLRSSWGLFYDWLPTNTYEQTLRVDGFRQQELNILNPSYPDLLDVAGFVPPINRYLLGGRAGAAAVEPRQPRHRSADLAPADVERDLQLHARLGAGARAQPERAGRRRPARTRRSATSSRSSPTPARACTSCRSMSRPIPARCCPPSTRRASAGSGRRSSPTTRSRRSRTTPTARSRFRHSGDLDDRVGTGRRRRPPPAELSAQQPDRQEPAALVQRHRQQRHAVHDPHRPRRQRRSRLQRSAGRRRTQHRARRGAVNVNTFFAYMLRVRPDADRPAARRDGHRRRRRADRPELRAAAALRAAVLRAGAEPDQPPELRGLQRHAHVAVLRPADDGHRHAEGGRGDQRQLLDNVGKSPVVVSLYHPV